MNFSLMNKFRDLNSKELNIKYNPKGVTEEPPQTGHGLCNQVFDHMGVINSGQFPIQSLMLDGKELVLNSK